MGLNGAVFKDVTGGRCLGSPAAFAMIATALLLPRYLASGFTTATAFWSSVSTAQPAKWSPLFSFSYITVLLPVVLTGSLAIKTMFGWHQPMWTIVIGSEPRRWYAFFGG